VLWEIGLWDGYNTTHKGNPDIRLAGIPFIKSNSFHYSYHPKAFPLNLTVFSVRQFLFTRKGQDELLRWDKYVSNKVNYVLVKTDNHLRILDDENLDDISERMKKDIQGDHSLL
jgi:hypothetical protein